MGGKNKRSPFYYDLWNMKYLSKFKWFHLTEEIREQKRFSVYLVDSLSGYFSRFDYTYTAPKTTHLHFTLRPTATYFSPFAKQELILLEMLLESSELKSHEQNAKPMPFWRTERSLLSLRKFARERCGSLSEFYVSEPIYCRRRRAHT